jgi:hypothetical protein
MNRLKDYRKTIPFTIASKNKIPANKLNKGSGKTSTTEDGKISHAHGLAKSIM